MENWVVQPTRAVGVGEEVAPFIKKIARMTYMMRGVK